MDDANRDDALAAAINVDRRGVLYPQHLPEFHRLQVGPELAHAARWFWIPEWDLPDGVESRQELLPFPACNLVISADGVTVAGPATQRSERVLSGRGWAVGALLRPAATLKIVQDPRSIRDTERRIDAPDLHAAVARAMEQSSGLSDTEPDQEARRRLATRLVSSWISKRVAVPDTSSEGAIANALEARIADPEITRADQLPEALHTSARTLQRLADRAFGVSLHAMIRRRRLQEAADRLRTDAELRIATLATELGYSDHAHFTTDFRAQLGVTPSDYRLRAAKHLL